MKIQVISYGKNSKRQDTAQIVIKTEGRSQTKHLVKIREGVYVDKDNKTYSLGD